MADASFRANNATARQMSRADPHIGLRRRVEALVFLPFVDCAWGRHGATEPGFRRERICNMRQSAQKGGGQRWGYGPINDPVQRAKWRRAGFDSPNVFCTRE
jgi:hypothetical protein